MTAAWIHLVAVLIATSAIVVAAALLGRANRRVGDDLEHAAHERAIASAQLERARDERARAQEFLPDIRSDLEPGDPR